MWDDDTQPAFCANGDGNPIIGERINGMYGDTPVVDLLCAECLGCAWCGEPSCARTGREHFEGAS